MGQIFVWTGNLHLVVDSEMFNNSQTESIAISIYSYVSGPTITWFIRAKCQNSWKRNCNSISVFNIALKLLLCFDFDGHSLYALNRLLPSIMYSYRFRFSTMMPFVRIKWQMLRCFKSTVYFNPSAICTICIFSKNQRLTFSSTLIAKINDSKNSLK